MGRRAYAGEKCRDQLEAFDLPLARECEPATLIYGASGLSKYDLNSKGEAIRIFDWCLRVPTFHRPTAC